MRHAKAAVQTGLAVLMLAGLAACNSTKPARPTDSDSDVAPGDVTSARTVPASIIYPSGPWDRERTITVNKAAMVERAIASEPDATGQWTVQVSQRKPNAATWTDVQALIISRRDDGAIALHELTNFSRKSRAIFTPALVLCEGTISRDTHEGKANVRSTGLDGTSEVRTGSATATASVAGDTVTLTITMELSPATITRTATVQLDPAADSVRSETTQLLVQAGPFTVQRETRVWTTSANNPKP